ncbi:MAG: helix-turn-helix transcriptional regulator [Candidatus Binataceae bacterium]
MRGACRPGFAPWAMGSRFFGPGEVRLAILSLLSESPRHGYDLIKLLAERSGGVYRASAGTIYPTLQQLEDEGLVASDAQDGKRTYRITDDGKRELKRDDDTVRRIWHRARMWRDWRSAFDPDSAEIIRPAERVVKAALRAMSGGDDSARRVDRVREILERALRDLEDLGDRG